MAPEPLQNHLRALRSARGWSQATLAERAGLSRSGISAVESGRLVPSTAAALALAAALEVRVEDLFELGAEHTARRAPRWAWGPVRETEPAWCARVADATWLYPVERTFLGTLPNDTGGTAPVTGLAPEPTVVLAGCDPAVGLLAAAVSRAAGYRLLPLIRSSRNALELLAAGRVHLAGVHLGENDDAVREFGGDLALVSVAQWEEGLALERGLGAGGIRQAVRADLRWVGREKGAGARRHLDALFRDFASGDPSFEFEHVAGHHDAVAETIRSGWAQAGVCIRLSAERAGLDFLSIATESFELCTRVEYLSDPGVRAVIDALRTPFFHRQVNALPGYDATGAGEVREIA